MKTKMRITELFTAVTAALAGCGKQQASDVDAAESELTRKFLGSWYYDLTVCTFN